MTKSKNAVKIKTALVRPLFLILLTFALLLVPALAFAEGDDVPEAGDSGAQDHKDSLSETLTAGTCDSPVVFDQGPVFDVESPENTLLADTSSFESNTSAFDPPAIESDSPALEDSSSLPEEQQSVTLDGQQVPADQNDFESSYSPDPELSAPIAAESAFSTPLYFLVEQVSMSPLLNPGDIIELVSGEYTEGDLVVAQLANGTHVVKVLQGDLLVPLGAGVSYSAADLTILSKAALSSLTTADLEAVGLNWSSVLGASHPIDPVAPVFVSGFYEVDSLAKLYWIAAPGLVKALDGVTDLNQETRWSYDYRQTKDIDASPTSTWFSGAGWLPIGTVDDPFKGSYNGSGDIISGLFINRPDADGTGLFGFTGLAAKLSNISLEDVKFTSTNVEGTVGGLVGGHEGEIINSYVTGSINGINSVGGLVGSNWSGTITNSYATGSVNGESSVGGLVGSNWSGTITNSYATGNVEGRALVNGMNVGGLVGYSNGTIANSYATGEVKGEMTVGGLVGSNMEGIISSCYATGSVTGFVNHTGGLVGYSNGTITNSYWNIDSHSSPGIGNNSGTGDAIGKTAAEMKTLAFHRDTLGWSIVTTTATVNRGGYNPYPFPRLFWELGIGNSPIWYIYVSGEEGGNMGSGFNGGFNIDGLSLKLPPLPLTNTVLTNIPSQSANAIITPAFVTGGGAEDLNRAIAAYNHAMQSYEANYDTMSAAKRAVAEVELAIAKAAIIALQLRLAAENGQPVDLAALIAAYQAAQGVLNSNRGLLTPDQVAAAEALLNAIVSVISRFST